EDQTPLSGGRSDIWNDFDYSIHYDASIPGPYFNSASSLDNNDDSGFQKSLGIPTTRFGFNHVDSRPKEFASGVFIGRYTQEETSHPNFMYPGRLPTGSNPRPMDQAAAVTVANGVVTQFQGGPRRSQ